MPFSRRRFLGALAKGAPAVLLGGHKRAGRAQAAGQAAPVLTNHNTTGRAVVTEGRTLLITLAFRSDMEALAGSLPVQIQPVIAGDQFLTEPQELYFYP